MPKMTQAFDYYVRSLTTSLLAVGLVGAAVYSLIFRNGMSTALTGWAGVVVGFYFGGHLAFKGFTIGHNGSGNVSAEDAPHGSGD